MNLDSREGFSVEEQEAYNAHLDRLEEGWDEEREAEEPDECDGDCNHCNCFDCCGEDADEPWDGFNSDAEADADVLRSCGWGTDEDYGDYGCDGDY